MSTPNFLNELTTLSVNIMAFENKDEKLKEGLQVINSKLPAAVYLPFTNSKYNINY